MTASPVRPTARAPRTATARGVITGPPLGPPAFAHAPAPPFCLREERASTHLPYPIPKWPPTWSWPGGGPKVAAPMCTARKRWPPPWEAWQDGCQQAASGCEMAVPVQLRKQCDWGHPLQFSSRSPQQHWLFPFFLLRLWFSRLQQNQDSHSKFPL